MAPNSRWNGRAIRTAHMGPSRWPAVHQDVNRHKEGGLMGVFSSLFGGGRSSKEDLIRSLVKKRVSNDPMASRMGFDARMVDSLDALQLISTPEGSIVTIVETYALMKKQGASDQHIFDGIEAHRSTIGNGAMPSPLDLESYAQYRIAVECRHVMSISSGFVSEAVQICRQHFGC